MIVQILAF